MRCDEPGSRAWLAPDDIVDARDPERAGHAIQLITATLRARARRFLRRAPIVGYQIEDLVQEVWLALLDRDARRLRSWDPTRCVPLERYVAVIADRRLASLRARSRARRRSSPLAPLEATAAVADTATPEVTAGSAALLADWRARIDAQLAGRGRAVFELMILDLDPPQIAAALEVNRQVVYNWRHQIRALLSGRDGAELDEKRSSARSA